MTALPPADDELASALLDGEVTAEERARLDGDQRLAARVEQLRAVRRAVQAAPAQPDPERRAAAVAAALDQAAAPAAAAAPPLGPRSSRRPARWAAVAAAAVVVAGVAGVALTTRDRDTSGNAELATSPAQDAAGSTAAGTTVPAGAVPGADEGGGAEVGGAEGGGPAPAARLPAELGAASDDASLRALLELAGAARDTAAATSPCPVVGVVEQVVLVRWRGRPAVVTVVGGPPREAVVLDPQTCQELARVPLA